MRLKKRENLNLIIIDGMNLFHRAHHSFSNLSNKAGYPTGTVFGFLNSLLRYIRDFDSNRIVVCWEGGKLWRKELNKEYKGNRINIFSPQDQQFFTIIQDDVKSILNDIGVLQITKKGNEADDIIAHLTMLYKKNIIIISNDKDFFQLINDKKNVKCIRPDKKSYITMDEAAVIERFGVTAKRMAMYLAICGDGGDNVKGVRNFGEKKAAKILNQYKIIDKNILKEIFTDEERLQFYKSYKLVNLTFRNRGMNFKITDFSGINATDMNELKRKLILYEINKFGSLELKQLCNYTFKKMILNKLLGYDDEENKSNN